MMSGASSFCVRVTPVSSMLIARWISNRLTLRVPTPANHEADATPRDGVNESVPFEQSVRSTAELRYGPGSARFDTAMSRSRRTDGEER